MKKKNDAQLALEDALVRVEEGATTDSKTAVEEAMWRVIGRGNPFVSEDIIAEMGDVYATVREPRLLGAVIRIAANGGWIVPTGVWRNGTRKERHAAPVREWRPT